jgi:hexosaminidase
VLRNREKIEFMLMPRLLGLAERAWAADPAWATETDAARAKALHAQAWSVFANQVGQQVLPRLDADLSGAAAVGYRIPPPGLQSAGSQVQANAAWPGNTIRYTTDGSEPTATSTLVGGPIAATGAIRAAVFTPLGRRSASTLLAAP